MRQKTFSIERADFETAWQKPETRRQLLSEDIENIQNAQRFPALSTPSHGLYAAKYDYSIRMDDERYPVVELVEDGNIHMTLEEKLREARASLGIPVHGRNDVARAMKYYLYNRFKVPEHNLAFTKGFTYVFFTRPDLNLLNCNSTANEHVRSSAEATTIYRRNPDIFKLLTDKSRCADTDNFNMLLSNQVTSIDIPDNQLTVTEAGKNWSNYEMSYGEEFSGNAAGDFTCNFTETSDYSIIYLMRLWMLYIHNVKKGIWSPSYNLYGEDSTSVSTDKSASHVYSKTLDYAASCYVIKTGPDGSDVLYWIKYCGIIPTNTGESALSWDASSENQGAPKLSIKFHYMYKTPPSGISFLEFNRLSDTSGELENIEPWNPNYNHSDRPFVGAPYLKIDIPDHNYMIADGVGLGPTASRASIRLLFRKGSVNALTDDLMYRAK